MTALDSTANPIVYKEIPGVRGWRATSLGTVESCLNNGGRLTDRWRSLTPRYTEGTDRAALLTANHGGKLKIVSVRNLILAAFHGPCPEDCEAWVKNGDPRDTRPENLAWAPLEYTRLWSRLEPMPSGCWEWRGALSKKGYGKLKYKSKWYIAHQLAFELGIGPRPPGIFVLHECDNPPCCNPDHLFLGTNQDNVDDMMAKDRQAKGCKVPYENRRRGETTTTSKLTDDSVREIRRRYAAGGLTMKELGNQFGINAANVFYIVHKKTWAHVKDDGEPL